MPEKTKSYERVIFTPEVIKEAEKILVENLGKKERKPIWQNLTIHLNDKEKWSHDNEEEFFADYIKGFKSARFSKTYPAGKIEFSIYINQTEATVSMQNRADIERVFNVLESNVDKCRLPKQPREKSKATIDLVAEAINKIETHCPAVARKLRLTLTKLDSEDVEEWQNATMLVRDAWIELSQWLCKVNNIDTSDIPSDSVIEMLKKLKIDKSDERLFNLARASFGLYAKHHKRDIDLDTAIACVISTIVSMKTVIREVF